VGDLSNDREMFEVHAVIDLPSRLIEDVQRYLMAPPTGEAWEVAIKELSQSVGWLMRDLLEEDETWPEQRAEDGFLVDGDEKLSPSRVRLRGLLVSIQSRAGDRIDPMRATLDALRVRRLGELRSSPWRRRLRSGISRLWKASTRVA
jgi:hypothetical protein